MKLAGTLASLFLSVVALAADPAPRSDLPKCSVMTETFCSNLWAPDKLGNFDLKLNKTEPPQILEIRFGETANSISHARRIFLEAVKKNEANFPADIRRALKENNYFDFVDRYQNRSTPQAFTMKDFREDIWNINPVDKLGRVLWQTASERLNEKQPGYLTTPFRDLSSSSDRAASKELDAVYAEFLTTIWKNEPKWKVVETTFESIRATYIDWVKSNPEIPETLKLEFLEDLRTLKLLIPGSNPKWSRSDCGINERNAFYNPVDHEITVCAGTFTTGSSFQTISHEIAHSFGIHKRLLRFLDQSAYGKQLTELYKKVDAGEHYSCKDWAAYRARFAKTVKAAKPYVYLDEKMLSKFINRKLTPAPNSKELLKHGERYSKRMTRSFSSSSFTANILKPEEILKSGKKIPNARFMRPTLDRKWSNPLNILDNDWEQFSMFVTESYNCELEKKTPAPKALEAAIETAQALQIESWKVLLTMGGKYSYLGETTTEGYAQTIDEDLADSIASSVVAMALKKYDDVEERRATYLGAIAGYCDEPSFEESYPQEARVLQRLSNRSHSTMQARRENFFSPEVRASLQCQ